MTVKDSMKYTDHDILKGLIEIYQNDFMSGYDGNDKEELRFIFLELILEVTRYVNNFRYCSNTDCPCSPESSIQLLLIQHGDVIYNKLLGYTYPMCEVPCSAIKRFLDQFNKGPIEL